MNFIDKVLAGIYFYQISSDKNKMSRFSFFIARFTLVTPAGLGLVFILTLVAKFIDENATNVMPRSRVIAFILLSLFVGISYLFTSSNQEIFKFIQDTEDDKLKIYNSYFRYVLYGSGALFIVSVLVLK